jgi:cytochrome b561
MNTLRILLCLALLAGSERQANAAKKHHTSPHADPAGDPADTGAEKADASAGKAAEEKPAGEKPPLDFDFFAGQPGAGGQQPDGADPAAADIEAKSHTRRWMLRTHQILGITTWVLMAGTVVVGQFNYNQLYGGGNNRKWQTPHRALVLSTSVAFGGTAAFAIFAPNPYDKPLRLDTGLVHRVAVIGATLGMLTEAVLGWTATHQADAGNQNNLRTMARTHQIIGYATLGFLTVAGTVWLF